MYTPFPLSLLPLLVAIPLSEPSFAQDAPPAPTAAATPAPAATSVAVATPKEEIRETWNSAGQLVRRLTLEGGVLVEEVANTYDALGRLSQTRTDRDGHSTVETDTWNDDGTGKSKALTRDGAPTYAEAYTYGGGHMDSLTHTEGGTTRTTRWTYNARGEITSVETRGADGALLSQTVADREPPPPAKIPITLSLTGGVTTNSDVQSDDITAGFAITRKPTPDQYGTDHLEVSATGSYDHGTSKGVPTNDDLKAGVGLDYNEFVPRTSAFLFTAVERNPVANLDVDLEVAPIGVKYDLVPEGGVFWTDISFAPLWNFRSILVSAGDSCNDTTVDTDTHCPFNDLRGSFRLRLGLEKGGFKLKDTVEYLPSLTPTGGDFEVGLTDESIFRNTAALTIKLTGTLSLAEQVIFTRDLRLADQVDCSATPDVLLCDGKSLQSSSLLSLDAKF